MSRWLRASAVLAVGMFAAAVVLGACGTLSEFSSSPECPAPPAPSPTFNGPDSPSGSPNAPKLTALEIAQRLPPMPSIYAYEDKWVALEPFSPQVAYRTWTAATDSALGNSFSYGGDMSLHTSLDDPSFSTRNGYRCVAICGTVWVEIVAGTTKHNLPAWVNDATSQSQSGLEQIFGGCPARDDVRVPSSEVSP